MMWKRLGRRRISDRVFKAHWVLRQRLDTQLEASKVDLVRFVDSLEPNFPKVMKSETPPNCNSFQVEIETCSRYFIPEVISRDVVNDLLTWCVKGGSISPADFERILRNAENILSGEPNVIQISDDQHVVVVGDLHGQIEDLEEVLRQGGDSVYIFNGDFVDRGLNRFFISSELLISVCLFHLQNEIDPVGAKFFQDLSAPASCRNILDSRL